MINFIYVNNGVAWIENDKDQIFGIISDAKVIDEDGLTHHNKTAFDLLDENENFTQNYDLECNIISIRHENGENSELRIFNNSFEYLDHMDLEKENQQ